MIRILITIGIFLFLFGSCTQKPETYPVSVSGYFPELAGQNLFLVEMEPLEVFLVDSTTIDVDGRYIFNLDIPEAGFFILKTGRNNNIFLQLDKFMDMLIQI